MEREEEKRKYKIAENSSNHNEKEMEEKGSLTQKSSASKAPNSLFTSLLEIPILCQNAAASSEQIVDRFENPRYKTEMCRNFKERSKCIYGQAHHMFSRFLNIRIFFHKLLFFVFLLNN